MKITTKTRVISEDSPAYLIAEIGSNFNGDLKKAKRMIDLAVEVGADCAKFQTFKPSKIVSERGFGETNKGFQAKWKKPVYEVYKDAMLPREWHRELMEYCATKNIDFSSSPYDKEAVDLLMDLDVDYIKIGSGEVSNLPFIKYVAQQNKPLLIGVGASTLAEIDEMVSTIEETGNQNYVLMQCVTNYPAPFEEAHIRVVETLQKAFGKLTGYSDHTPGHTVPLGAITLGAKVIEKHFTDDKKQEGPDHAFAMDPDDFSKMVQEVRNLEKALGSSRKIIYSTEAETQILQRRSLYAVKPIKKGSVITEDMVEALRPAKGLPPKFLSVVLGSVAVKDWQADTPITWDLIIDKK